MANDSKVSINNELMIGIDLHRLLTYSRPLTSTVLLRAYGSMPPPYILACVFMTVFCLAQDIKIQASTFSMAFPGFAVQVKGLAVSAVGLLWNKLRDVMEGPVK